MSTAVEPNALLLQVMAHDLLSPLTALKWQVELLHKSGIDARKREEYLQSIADSTALGIAITKHAHVAASVLLGSYKKNPEPGSLATVLRTAAHNMTLQYERHGLTLEVDVRDDERVSPVDRELTGLLVWSIAKFFLTCTPAHTIVRITGDTHPDTLGGKAYVMAVRALDMQDCNTYVSAFSAEQAKDQYDQTHVFTTLIHSVAPLIGVEIVARAEGDAFIIETTFPLPPQ